MDVATVVDIVEVANFASGNTGVGIAQVINLVIIVFSIFSPTCFTGDMPIYTDRHRKTYEDIGGYFK